MKPREMHKVIFVEYIDRRGQNVLGRTKKLIDNNTFHDADTKEVL